MITLSPCHLDTKSPCQPFTVETPHAHCGPTIPGMSSPMHCRPCAFESFARQIPEIDTCGGDGLLAAALAIAMHEMDRLDVKAIDRQLQSIADEVRARVPNQVDQLKKRQPVNPEPVLAH